MFSYLFNILHNHLCQLWCCSCVPVGGKLVDLLKLVGVEVLDVGKDSVEFLRGLSFLHLGLVQLRKVSYLAIICCSHLL